MVLKGCSPVYLFMYTPCCSRPVPVSAQGGPAFQALPTSLTDRAPAASRSIGASRRGLVLGTPCRIAQPASASPDRPPVPHIHPVGPIRLAVGNLVSNPARFVAICMTAPARSPARG